MGAAASQEDSPGSAVPLLSVSLYATGQDPGQTCDRYPDIKGSRCFLRNRNN